MANIIKNLENPDYLNDVFNDICKLDNKNQSLFVKTLLFISKNLDNEEWICRVDKKVLFSLTINICKVVEDLSPDLYHNFLFATCHIFQYSVRMGLHKNDASYLNLIFYNSNLSLVNDHKRLYVNFISDCISNLNTVNTDGNLIVKNLDCITRSVKRLVEKCDVIHLCLKFLPWSVFKICKLFGKIVPGIVDEVLKDIFGTSLALINPEYKFRTECSDTAPIIAGFFSIISSISQTLSTKNRSIETIIEFYKKVFVKNESYSSLIRITSDAYDLYKNLGTTDIDLKALTKLCASIESKNEKTSTIYDFICTIRSLFHYKLQKLQDLPDDLWKQFLPIDLQLLLLKLIWILAKAFVDFKNRSITCNNCSFKSGIHDSLHVTANGLKIIRKSIKSKMNVTQITRIVEELYALDIDNIIILNKNNCPNWKDKCSSVQRLFSGLCYDMNAANLLESLIKFFQIGLESYVKIWESTGEIVDMETFGNFIYNMSICYLDLNRTEESLKMYYLNFILSSIYNSRSLEKTGKLIIKIKTANIEKNKTPEEAEKLKDLHMTNVWNVREEFKSDFYKKLIQPADFSTLLLLELEIYNKYWFSTVTVVGICKSLQDLYEYNKTLQNDKFDEYGMLVIMGKVITRINNNCSKLQNPVITSFIRFANEKFESFLLEKYDKLIAKDKIRLKFLYGCVLKALYAVSFYEKIDMDKFSSLPMKKKETFVTVHPDDVCEIDSTHLSLRFSVETDIVQHLLTAIENWKIILNYEDEIRILAQEESVEFMNEYVSNIESVMRILILRGLDIHSFKTADILLSFAKILDKKIVIVRVVSFIIQYLHFQNASTSNLIKEADVIVHEFLKKTESNEFDVKASDSESVYYYLLNLCVYYYNCNFHEKGLFILRFVQNRILNFLSNSKEENRKNINFVYAKLLDVQSLYVYSNNKNKWLNDKVSYFASVVNTFSAYFDTVRSVGHLNWRDSLVIHSWIESGLHTGKVALMLGIPRKCRCILKSIIKTVQRLLLPRRIIEFLLLLANSDIVTESYDDCKVKLDSINYILDEKTELKQLNSFMHSEEADIVKPIEKFKSNMMESITQFEVILDSSVKGRRADNDGSPVFQSSPFVMPSFIDHHRKCDCDKCHSFIMFNLTLGVLRLKANLFWRTEEPTVAQSFINGGLKVLQHLDARSNYIFDFTKQFKNIQFDTIDNCLLNRIFTFEKCQFLYDLCLFLIQEDSFSKAETLNGQIIEMLQYLPPNNLILSQSVHELKLFFHQHKLFCQSHDKREEMDQLVTEFDNKFFLTPVKKSADENCFKTPMAKNIKPPTRTKAKRGNLFKDFDKEPLVINRPVIKINLDNADDEKPILEEKDNVNDCESVEATPLPERKFYNKTRLINPEIQSSKRNSGRSNNQSSATSTISSNAQGRTTRASSRRNATKDENKNENIAETKSAKESTNLCNKKWKL